MCLCFDCHNSHGSDVSGTTTSYASATTNGGILKDTTSRPGRLYSDVQASGFCRLSPTMITHKAGAGLCFDCHMTATADVSKPWGYQNTFGARTEIIGYLEKPDGRRPGVNSSGPQQRYAYKASAWHLYGGHLGASSPLNTTPNYTIGGLCTPCHDPHGVSPTLARTSSTACRCLKAPG